MRRFVVLLLCLCLLSGCKASSPAETTAPTTPVTTTPVTAATDAPTTAPEQHYVEVSREGMTEQIPVELVQGGCAGYTMAMDPGFFTFHPGAELDRYTYDGWYDPEGVYYTVRPISDAEAGTYVDRTLALYGERYAQVSTESISLAGFPTTVIRMDWEQASSGYCRHIFLLDTVEGFFVIETQFTGEMYEGLYAIMRACFQTFRLS